MATFVSSAAVPQKTVYEVTRAVMENIKDFRKLHPAFRNLNAKDMISNGLSAPIHAGAMKYYKEKGWKQKVFLHRGRRDNTTAFSPLIKIAAVS